MSFFLRNRHLSYLCFLLRFNFVLSHLLLTHVLSRGLSLVRLRVRKRFLLNEVSKKIRQCLHDIWVWPKKSLQSCIQDFSLETFTRLSEHLLVVLFVDLRRSTPLDQSVKVVRKRLVYLRLQKRYKWTRHLPFYDGWIDQVGARQNS